MCQTSGGVRSRLCSGSEWMVLPFNVGDDAQPPACCSDRIEIHAGGCWINRSIMSLVETSNPSGNKAPPPPVPQLQGREERSSCRGEPRLGDAITHPACMDLELGVHGRYSLRREPAGAAGRPRSAPERSGSLRSVQAGCVIQMQLKADSYPAGSDHTLSVYGRPPLVFLNMPSSVPA